jgi:hypothetical protein
MASTNRIPPSVAALFAQRSVVPRRVQDRPPPPKREDRKITLDNPPPRTLRRGSLLNLLV